MKPWNAYSDFFLSVNPQSTLQKNNQLRHRLTGFWLIENEAYTRWLGENGRILWLHGIAGAGKSVLSGLIIQHCLERADANLRQGVAFFFCSYDDEKSQTVVNILAALASQLGRQNKESFEILRSLFTELHPKSRLKRDPEAEELAEAIRNMAVTFDDVRIVVDGLDECSDEAREAAHVLHAIASEHVSISVAILSRDEPHIRQELPRASCHYLAIEAQTKDLDLYVRGEIERRIERKPRLLRDYELKEEMIRKLVSESQGM
jgi:hypothetical protein